MTKTTIHCDKCEAPLTKRDVRTCTALYDLPPMQMGVTACFHNNNGGAYLCRDCKGTILTHLLSMVYANYGSFEREDDKEPATEKDLKP